jgi:hypothetical protein
MENEPTMNDLMSAILSLRDVSAGGFARLEHRTTSVELRLTSVESRLTKVEGELRGVKDELAGANVEISRVKLWMTRPR